MKVFGIIMETNPLHNGHSYFIKKIKEIGDRKSQMNM